MQERDRVLILRARGDVSSLEYEMEEKRREAAVKLEKYKQENFKLKRCIAEMSSSVCSIYFHSILRLQQVLTSLCFRSK